VPQLKNGWQSTYNHGITPVTNGEVDKLITSDEKGRDSEKNSARRKYATAYKKKRLGVLGEMSRRLKENAEVFSL